MALSGHWGNLQIPVHHATQVAAGATDLPWTRWQPSAAAASSSAVGIPHSRRPRREARNPQRKFPWPWASDWASAADLSGATAVVSSERAADLLQNGWHHYNSTSTAAPGGLALGLGLGWMVVLLLTDAALSPSHGHGLSGSLIPA